LSKTRNLALLCQFHHRAGLRRTALPEAEWPGVDNVAPGYRQPLGDVRKLPAGKASTKWHGEHMSLDLAVAVVLQERWDVPAGTSKTIQVA